MNVDEGLTTKLWLEKHRQPAIESPAEHLHYKVIKYKFEKKTQQAIAGFFKKNHLQWNDVIHAAWGLLLNRFSSTDFLLFGAATLYSSKSNILKINPAIIPIKSIINEKLSVKSFLQKIKMQLHKKNHLKEKISDDVRYLLIIEGGKKKSSSMLMESERFPLILFAHKKDLSKLAIYYHPELFDRENIDHIFHHLLVILEEFSKNIQNKIVKINILTPEEKELVLSRWSKPTYPFPIPNLRGCMHELFMREAKKYPDNIAIEYNGEQITYKKLDTASTQLSQSLIKKGIKPGDLVCVLMDRTSTLIMVMLAIFKTGAVYVPINPKYPDDRIKFILDDTQSQYVLVNDAKKLPEHHSSQIIEIPSTWNALNLDASNHLISLPSINDNEMAYIIYTSGTTGQPKGVMIRHHSLVNLIAWYQACFQVTEKDRASQFASQGFDTYLCETAPFLASGASVHIVDDHTKLTPSLFFDWLEKQKITICDLPTSYALTLFLMPWPKNSCLKTVKIGGEAVTHYPDKQFSFDIWNCYGPTETTIEATYVKIYTANTPATS